MIMIILLNKCCYNAQYAINAVGKIEQIVQKCEIKPSSYTIYRINSKWIKELTVTLETMKMLGENRQYNDRQFS